MRRTTVFSFLFFVFIGIQSASAQENSIHRTEDRLFELGLEHLNNKELEIARAYFQRFLDQKSHYTQSHKLLQIEDAQYHILYIDAQLGKSGAEDRLAYQYQFAQGSRKSKLGYHLANLYFEKGQYALAANNYGQIQINDLPADWRDQFSFKNGYSLMEENKTSAAISNFEKVLTYPKSKYISDAKYYLGVLLFNEKNLTRAEHYLSEVSKQSSSKNVNYLLAQIQFSKKNYPEAITLLRNDQSNTLGKNGLMGKSFFEIKDYQEAQSYLSRHLTETSKISAEDMYQLAFSEYKSGMFSQAIEHFRELQLSNHFGQYAMYALADCYLRNKDKQNALSAYSQAAAGSQDAIITQESKFNVAKLKYDLKDYNGSISALNEYLTSYPNSTNQKEALTILTSALLYANNYPQAINVIEKNAALQEGNERLYQEICYAYALQLFQSGDKEQALKLLRKSIANPFDRPLEAEARYLRADILFRDGDYDQAEAEYNEVFKIIQKEKIRFAQNATLFNVHYGLAYCRYLKKDYTEASAQFQNASRNYVFNQNQPKSNTMQDIDLRIADIYFLEKKYDQAYQQYSKISLERGRGYDYATLQKANIDGVKKNYDNKITTLTKLIREVPNSPYADDAKYQLGLAYEDNRNNKDALATYNELESKTRSPEYAPKALVRQAIIYYNAGQINDALGKYSRIAESYSQSPEADQALKALKEIYLRQGRAEDYIAFVNKLPNGKQLAASEQDSILFEAVESAYTDNNCDQSIVLINRYLEKFSLGIFASKAYFYKAECYAKKKMYLEAVDAYSFLTKDNNNPYYERSLVRSAYFSYNLQKNYAASKSLYQKLTAIASTSQNKQAAKIGLLESNYQLKNYADVVDIAKLIEADADIDVSIKNDAIFYRAKSLYFLKNYTAAQPIFEAIVKDKTYKHSAEATYYIGSILSLTGQYKKSNDLLMTAKDDFGSYETWVIRYFILIGWNYHKLGDNFQAKATIESILSNYQGDAIIVQEAKEKLAEIEKKMKETSKVKYK